VPKSALLLDFQSEQASNGLAVDAISYELAIIQDGQAPVAGAATLRTRTLEKQQAIRDAAPAAINAPQVRGM
jgi:hypothetical protein